MVNVSYRTDVIRYTLHKNTCFTLTYQSRAPLHNHYITVVEVVLLVVVVGVVLLAVVVVLLVVVVLVLLVVV